MHIEAYDSYLSLWLDVGLGVNDQKCCVCLFRALKTKMPAC